MGTSLKIFLVTCALGFLAMPAWAQSASSSATDDAIAGYESAAHQSFQGIATDWTSHHVVFSNAALGSDAEDKVQQDPRYWLQQIRRTMQASEDLDATDSAAVLSDKKDKKKNKKKKSTLTGLWSVNLGSGATVGNEMDPATFTAGTSASCINDFVVYNTSLTGTAATSAIGTGTFATPATSVAGSKVTINGVTLTATGVGTDTITSEPGSGTTTVIDGVTYTWTTTTCAAFTPTATSGCVVRTTGGSPTTAATNLAAAINNSCSGATQCLVSGANPGATATTSTSVVIVTNTTAGAITWSVSGQQTLAPTGSISAASTSGTTFALSTNTTTAATNLAQAINNNLSTDVTATPSTNTVKVTATTAGTAGNSITTAETLAAFSWGGTTLAGGTAGTASIVGFNNIYAGTCTTGTVPTVNWAFNTGGTVVTSPAISASGQEVAFVQSVSGAASLVILKWSAGNGTLTAPTALTSNSSYPSCTAPCMISLPFSGGADDTNSSPFAIVFGPTEGTLYVGDDAGKLHKFTNIFTGGTPVEAGSPWPVTVASGIVMSSPVADANTSIVFVGDASGNIHTISFAGTVATVALGGTIVDGPLLDVSVGKVFWFDATTTGTLSDKIEQTDEALANARVVTLTASAADRGNMHAGAFDNTYYTTPTSGFLYVCAVSAGHPNHPSLYRIGFTNAPTTAAMNTTVSSGPLDMVSASASPNECSPLTEIQTSSTDDFFVSVQQEGGLTHCTGACLYSFAISGQTFPAGSTAGLQSAGGTSGISIDNIFSATGASQVYFTPLANQACTTGGTGGCAYQASQAGLD